MKNDSHKLCGTHTQTQTHIRFGLLMFRLMDDFFRLFFVRFGFSFQGKVHFMWLIQFRCDRLTFLWRRVTPERMIMAFQINSPIKWREKTQSDITLHCTVDFSHFFRFILYACRQLPGCITIYVVFNVYHIDILYYFNSRNRIVFIHANKLIIHFIF